MKLIGTYLFVLLFGIIVYAQDLPSEAEEDLLSQLSSADVFEVAEALDSIWEYSYSSPEILISLSTLMRDTRTGWVTEGDVIDSVDWLAYRALKELTGFKPSQPSISFDKQVGEMEEFLLQEYPKIFKSIKFHSSKLASPNQESGVFSASKTKSVPESNQPSLPPAEREHQQTRETASSQKFRALWVIAGVLSVGVIVLIFKIFRGR